MPLIRTNRAVAACLIYPHNPLAAIAISETVNCISPILNPKMFSRIIALTIVMLYAPKFTNFYIQKYSQINLQYQQAEICCLLLFILYYGCNLLSSNRLMSRSAHKMVRGYLSYHEINYF